MPRPFHTFLFVNRNNIWSGAQTLKLLSMQFSPVLCNFRPLRPKHLPQHPAIDQPQPVLFPWCKTQVSYIYKTTGKIATLNTDAPWLRHSSVLTPRPSVHMHRLPTCELVKRKHGSVTKIQRHSKRTKTKTEGPDATLARVNGARFIHHSRVVTDCVMVVSRKSGSVCILIFMFFSSCYMGQN
jgi:hypothetical protein